MITIKQILFRNVDILSIFSVLISISFYYNYLLKSYFSVGTKMSIIFKIIYQVLIFFIIVVLYVSCAPVAMCMERPVVILNSETNLLVLFQMFLDQYNNNFSVAFSLFLRTVLSVENFPYLMQMHLTLGNDLSLSAKFQIFINVYKEMYRFGDVFTEIMFIYNDYIRNNPITDVELIRVLTLFFDTLKPILKNVMYLNAFFFDITPPIIQPLQRFDPYLGHHIMQYLVPTYFKFRGASLLVFVEVLENLKLMSSLIFNLQNNIEINTALIETGSTTLSEVNFRSMQFLTNNNWNTSESFRIIYDQFVNLPTNGDLILFIQNYIVQYSTILYDDVYINYLNHHPEEVIETARRMRSVPRLLDMLNHIANNQNYVNLEIHNQISQQIDSRIQHLRDLHTSTGVISNYNLRPR